MEENIRHHYESNHKANFEMLESTLKVKFCLEQQHLFRKANESSE